MARFTERSQKDMGFEKMPPINPKPDVIAPHFPSGSSRARDANLYAFVVPDPSTGLDKRCYWRGGENCLDALAMMREEGVEPLFIESLKGGAPGHWSPCEAAAGITQDEMDL